MAAFTVAGYGVDPLFEANADEMRRGELVALILPFVLLLLFYRTVKRHEADR